MTHLSLPDNKVRTPRLRSSAGRTAGFEPDCDGDVELRQGKMSFIHG